VVSAESLLVIGRRIVNVGHAIIQSAVCHRAPFILLLSVSIDPAVAQETVILTAAVLFNFLPQ